MYRKIDIPIPPVDKIDIEKDGEGKKFPIQEGDTVICKAGKHIILGVFVENIEKKSIKGEVTITGGVKFPDESGDICSDVKCGDKIEIDIDKIEDIINKHVTEKR